jgi:hypothetical protein
MTDDRRLDDLIEQLVLALDAGDIGVVSRMVEAHPDFEHQLTAFMVTNALLAAPAIPDELQFAAKTVTSDLRERALAAAAGSVEASLVGLFRQAASQGMDARGFAAAMDLPRDLLTKLDRRLIVAQSIPRRCMQRMAEVLQVRVEAVHAYLTAGQPARVAAFNYAAGPPQITGQDSFSKALATSSLATPAQRELWLKALRDEKLT